MWLPNLVHPTEWRGQKSQPVNFIHKKENGRRLTILHSDKGIQALTKSRAHHLDVSSHLWWRKWFKDLVTWMPPFSAIDGELILPGEPNTEVISALKNNRIDLCFMPFAVPCWNSKEVPFDTLEEVEAFAKKSGLSFPAWSLYKGETRKVLEERAREEKIEGYVLKENANCGWYKVKPLKTVECFVTGIKPGYGKYTGMCGALLVSVDRGGKQVEVAAISGMSDLQRSAMGEDTVGRIVEVQFQNLGAGGRLIHPQFVRFRDDKTTTDCTWNRIIESEGVTLT